ncbi:MAG TPA: helix-turn-helix transcriptional regulator [Ktedonobacteraceae bacterium]|nr:helix-turn-helix transcriptional regulator [Ktedonobacteraceae bacterium]
MAMQESSNRLSLLSQVLKEYRKSHGLTQEQLAEKLSIEPRTLRSWENERPSENIRELRRIADTLGIEPERLGIATSVFIPRTPGQIEGIIQHAWSLVEESHMYQARTTIERLIQNIQTQITPESPELLTSLAHAYHAAGYIVSEATRANESFSAIAYYHQMEMIARTLDDHTLLNIALTYQGDMYRRLGEVTKAITYLEAARDTTPHADIAARGNGIQLLGRAYLHRNDMADFEIAMAEAEKLASIINPATSSTHGHYNLGTVYEEYARSYTDLGQMQKALKYLDQAESNLPPTRFWELLITTSRAMALVKGGQIETGIELAVQAANQIRSAGIFRFLERIYAIDQHLEKLERQIGQSRGPLREVLDGGKVIDL